ncbi:myc protein [Uranotaenia lowii]|uniref:myc protein n=1 Tax=Uranotaenia lowii TaxID=190385 RepID=UPI00247A8053|nr:myc protein [Uranotaenia lowii]XP_055587936.1 myc protein [Uranotaenia lowii]XP_055587937.1 myc protein [Uranotaenia lowii]XP_055587938.1 myc protein [Uranotaenia lowii]XP_055587940.1 myc protein [Uranotaenia lowii]
MIHSMEDNSIDASLDWQSVCGLEVLELPTSEFLESAHDIEAIYGSASDGFGGDQLASSKHQIRNHDCMWSGSCVDQSHPGKFGFCGNNTPAVTVVPEPSANKFSTVTAVAAASLNVAVNQKPILAPSNNSTLNINNNITSKINNLKIQSAQIPAGRSLLINPRNKQTTQRVPTITTNDFLRERESTVSLHTRPDTPLSLDEDPPEFKHNSIDLAACTIGSNRLSLVDSRHSYHHSSAHHDDASSHRIINMLKEQLEDNDIGSMRSYMTSSTGEIGSLTDLLNDLEEIDADDSNDDELASDTDSNIDGDSCSRQRSSKGGGGSLSGGYTHAHHQEMSPPSSSSGYSSSPSSSSYEYQGTHVGDHSYTRPKNRYNMNELGVQTPSDSEEEIDVVSIGEKNLPTNPTARAKKELQLRVAHKIARKHSQTTVNGSSSSSSGSSSSSSHQQQHHHRNRHLDEDEYGHGYYSGGSGSSSQASPSKLNGYSPNYLTPASSTGTNTPLPGSSSSSISNPRKRPNKDDHHRSSSKNRHHHQHRNKKQRSIPGKKPPTAEVSEEQDNLEKRNLHNDMERQRRIGLKNLFEELKRQIPSLREKERAPKVNILREASILCQRLNREQEQLNALRKQQQRLYARVRQLRTSLHSQRRTMD